jgi:polar amino acid transport system substrate-binding protein
MSGATNSPEVRRRRRRSRLLAAAALGLLLGGLVAVWLLMPSGGLSLVRRDGTWARMVDDAIFRVGMDPSFPPFESLDESGQPVGFDVDLAHAMAERWGMRLELTAMGYDSLVDAALATQVDAVISAMPYDERLTRDLSISAPYFEAGLRLAVPAESPLAGVEDLAGSTVAVEWGSAGDMVARRLLREQTPTPGEDAPLFAIAQYDIPDDAMGAAVSGAADAVLVDAVSLRLAQGRGLPLVAVGPVLEGNPYVILAPRRATTLASEINKALAALRDDGTLAALEERWFGALPAATGEAPASRDTP